MKVYRVWFQQINQTYIDTEAPSDVEAVKIAREIWKQENDPSCIHIEDKAK